MPNLRVAMMRRASRHSKVVMSQASSAIMAPKEPVPLAKTGERRAAAVAKPEGSGNHACKTGGGAQPDSGDDGAVGGSQM